MLWMKVEEWSTVSPRDAPNPENNKHDIEWEVGRLCKSFDFYMEGKGSQQFGSAYILLVLPLVVSSGSWVVMYFSLLFNYKNFPCYKFTSQQRPI